MSDFYGLNPTVSIARTNWRRSNGRDRNHTCAPAKLLEVPAVVQDVVKVLEVLPLNVPTRIKELGGSLPRGSLWIHSVSESLPTDPSPRFFDGARNPELNEPVGFEAPSLDEHKGVIGVAH